jgi:hypothetical protein
MDNIPRTGRIGRFAKIVEKEVDQDVFLRIMQDSDAYAALKPEKKADWWKSAMDRLESEVGEQGAIEIMHACGRKCCNTGTRKSAKRLKSESNSLQEFLKKASTHGVKEGQVEYKSLDQKTIVGYFYRCLCGQVRQTPAPFPSLVYCQCSAEFHKQYFATALEREVQVEITQSILKGADHCEFLIHLR